MPVRKLCGLTSARSPYYKALLYKERLIDLFKRSLVLPNSCSYGIGPYRTSLEFGYYSLENLVVNRVQSPLVYVQGVKSISGYPKIFRFPSPARNHAPFSEAHWRYAEFRGF